MSLGRPFIFVKLATQAAGDLLLLKVRTFHMSSAVTPVTELLPTRLTLKLFLGWKHSAVNNLFHQISKYIYKHSRLERERRVYCIEDCPGFRASIRHELV